MASCKWVRLACERHIKDLRREDIWFDAATAEFAIKFIEFLPQSKGEFAGKPLILQEWQKFIVGSIFGWRKPDGTRRFKKAYIEIPRKNGKTTLAAAIALYGLIADGEEGAEVYFAATKREQAAICFDEACNMINQSAELDEVKALNSQISFAGSKAKKISADKKQSGLNVHMAIIDELWEHPTSKTVDLMTTGTGSRMQPLIFEITTAGERTDCVCYDHHKLTKEVLQGVKINDSWFGVIYAPDKDDDIHDKATWYKSNPNLGVSKKLAYMEEQYTTATTMPSYMNAFMQLDLDAWVGSHSLWVEDEHWTACVGFPSIEKTPCWGGLDKASVRDFTAFTLCFDVGGVVHFKRWFWIPEATYKARKMNATSTDLDEWIANKWLKVTPGNALDDTVVINDIIELSKIYDIRSIGYDRHKAETLASQLASAEIEIYEFGQGYLSMSEPTKALEKTYVNRNCTHDGSPVQRWMMTNVLLSTDPAGNIKIDKSKSTEKVDGPVSEVMAYGTYLSTLIEEPVHFISWKSTRKT